MEDMSKTERFSDLTTNLDAMKQFIKEFCERRDWDQIHGPKDLAIGVVTEASELIENFRFYSEDQCREMLKTEAGRERVSDELADVFFFLLRFSQMYEIDLARELGRKMRKNSAKYTVERSRGNQRKYSDPERG